MISTFVPVSDSFVVAGTSDSQIQVIQFPTPDPTSYFNGTMTRASPRFAGVRHATSTTTLGKCSFWPVNGMAHMDETVAAVSATTLSTWDLVKNRRVRHVTTPDHSTTCNYIGAKLLAVAGHGRSVHIYDMRVSSMGMSQAPAWSAKLASDNLYASAVDGCTVFTAGADGCIYALDLRAQHKHRWDLQPNCPNQHSHMDSSILSKHAASSATHDKKESVAVLDLKVSGKDIFCTLESGQLCGVPRVFTSSDPLSVSSNEQTHSLASGGDFLFAERFSLGPVSSRIRCDVLNGQDTVHLVAGSESGSISHYKYDQKSRQASLVQTESVAPPSTVISGVSWSPSGVYASSGDAISLIAFG